jgi:hypothetical protein
MGRSWGRSARARVSAFELRTAIVAAGFQIEALLTEPIAELEIASR